MKHFTQPFTDDVPMWTVYFAITIVATIILGFLLAKRKDQRASLMKSLINHPGTGDPVPHRLRHCR
jgi:hypothetical protein